MEGYNIGMESVSVASRARKILLKHKIKSRVVRSKSESGCSFSLYIDRSFEKASVTTVLRESGINYTDEDISG